MIDLRIVPAEGAPFGHRIDTDSVVIGRASTAGLTLLDRSLSREHARLFRNGSTWYLEDLGSRNGSFVNGAMIRSATPVSPGDVIGLGSCTITVEDGTSASAATGEASDFGEHTIFRSVAELLHGSGVSRPVAEVRGEEELRRYIERLRMLNEVHQALGRSIGLEELLGLILDRVFDHLRPEQGAIFLRGKDGVVRRAASRSVAGSSRELVYSSSLAREVAGKGMAALVLDAQVDERFAQAQSIMLAGLRSLIAAPLLDPSGALGMIVLASKATVRQFSEEDLELLVSLASVAALRIRDVAAAEEAALRRRLEDEIALARRIQVALLPSQLPTPAGWEMYGGNIPSRGCSGDYYEVIERKGGSECVLMVADVSGKGIGAALLTASLEALSVGPLEDGLEPDEVCVRLSRLLFARTPPEKYATVFLAALDVATGRVRFTNAGHNAGLVVRTTGAIEWLASCGPPIGLLPGATYGQGEVVLGPKDILILYTDGITEACNPSEEEYGKDRLAAVCVEGRESPLETLAGSLETDLDGFTQGVPYADDRTVVMVRRLQA